MLSMPPATITSFGRAASASQAIMTVFIPDPHILLTVVHGTDCGSPAPSAACRAGAWPRPAGSTQPISTSLMSCGSTPTGETAGCVAAAPSAGADNGPHTPWNPPIAVRTLETITIGSVVEVDLAMVCLRRAGAGDRRPL